VRNRQHGQVVDSSHVSVHYSVILLEGSVLHGSHLYDAGVVDQDVQPLKFFDGCVYDFFAVFLIADIGLYEADFFRPGSKTALSRFLEILQISTGNS